MPGSRDEVRAKLDAYLGGSIGLTPIRSVDAEEALGA